MMPKIVKFSCFAIGLCLVVSVNRPCFGGSIKAFSLREANRLLEQGKLDSEELRTLGGMTRVVGMVFDRENSDIILVGKVRSDLPPASIDDLAVAMRSRLLKGQYPKVSIDMVEDTPKTGMQDVRFEGGIQKTKFGEDFLDSDVILKRYSLDLLRHIEGMEPYLKLYEAATKQEMAKEGHAVETVNWLPEEESKQAVERYVGKMASESKTVQSRFWYYVMDDESFIVEQDDVYVIEELRLGVKAETLLFREQDKSGKKSKEAKDEIGEEFAKQFTEHFWEACDEHVALKRLKVLFDLVCIAEGVAHLGKDRPNFDYLLKQYRIPAVDTPEHYRLVQRVGEFRGQDDVSQLVQLSGGIELEAILLALEDGDVSALKMAVLLSRPDERSLCWDLPLDEWEMPNDQPPCKESGRDAADGVTKIQPDKLGFALTVRRYVFDPKRPGGPALKFRGFPAPPPVKRLEIPDPTFNKLRRLPRRKPAPFVLPGPLAAPVLTDGNQIRWSLALARGPGHAGGVLFLPTGQLHDGPGDTGAAAAVYHWHPLDSRTGIYAMTAIPLDGSGRPVGIVPEKVPDTSSTQGLVPASIKLELQDALANADWRRVTDIVSTSAESLLLPVPRLALAHAMLAENHNNEAVALFASVTQKLALVAWRDWTRELANRHPSSTAAHYLYGDALARFQRWDEAEAKFTAAIKGFDPQLRLAGNARGVVYAAKGMRDKAIGDLTALSLTAPDFADAQHSLGALWTLLRVPEGAERAYKKALEVNSDFALAVNGLGCATYGLGKWDGARTYFEQAAQYPDVVVFQVASANVLALLAEQAEFYVSADPADLLPAGSRDSGGTTQAVEPSPVTEGVAGQKQQPARPTYRPATTYRPPVPTYQPWTQTYHAYRHQAEVMRQRMEIQQRQWESRMHQRYHDIGGITMNMQKALADRGDWPVGTFFSLGYFEVRPDRVVDTNKLFQPEKQADAQKSEGSGPQEQRGNATRRKRDFAAALAEFQKAGKPLTVEVVSAHATLQAGSDVLGNVSQGEVLYVTEVNGEWLWVESVEGRQLEKPGWIDQEHVR